MNDTQTATRLHPFMAAMVALEQTIGQRVEYLLNEVIHNPEIVTSLQDLHALTGNQRQALATRLQVIAPDVPIPDTATVILSLEGHYDGVKYPASATLLTLYTLFDQAVIGYAVLMVLARRAADSNVRGPDNTDDLVQQHMRTYTAAVQRIVRLLPGVMVGEL